MVHFANPLMLFLSAGAVVPLIIHLLSRRRPRVVQFPAVRFLRTAARRAVTRTNLKYLLLLLLRMALIALLALMLARPSIGGSAAVQRQDKSGDITSAIFIIDDSLSMNYRRGDASWFERARGRALEVLDRLPSPLEVAVTTTSGQSAQFTQRREDAAGRLKGLKATLRADSCVQQLDRSAKALKERAAGARTIYLFTDMTSSAWAGLGQPLNLGPETSLEVIDVGDVDAANLAVTAVRDEGGPVIRGGTRSVEVEVLCTGKDAQDAVELELDGRTLGRQPIQVKAGQTQRIALNMPVESTGHHWGRVSLQNTDALPYDDSRAFTFEAGEAVSVLCVESPAPATGVRRVSSAYFFRSALSPWSRADAGIFKVRTITLSELDKVRLSDFDLVALIDTPGPDDAGWKRLDDFVSSGGGLLISAGPAAAEQTYNGPEAHKFLPAALGEVGGGTAPAAKLLRMRVVETKNPFVEALGQVGADVGRATFRQCRALVPTETGEEVLSMAPELPALILGRGAGKVAVFAGSMGTDWSDFPTLPDFVPFCQELVLYLTGASGGRLSGYLIGQHVPVSYEEAQTPTEITVTQPGGPPGGKQATPLMPGTTPGRRLFWKTETPGYYRLAFSRKDKQWAGGFAINTDPLESDLRRVGDKDIEGAIKAGGVAIHRDTSEVNVSGGAAGKAAGGARELTVWLALAALAMCVGELFLANRVYRT